MIRSSLLAAAAGAALLSVTPSSATCGSAQCFLDTGSGEGLQGRGSFLVELTYQSVDQSKKLSGSDGVGEVLTPKIDFENGTIEPDHHREIRTENTLVRLNLAYGITDRLAVYALVPLINDRDHEHFDEVGTPAEFFTNADGTSGFGDVRVGARYGFLVKGRDVLSGDFAIKVPTGSYRQLDSEGSVNEPTIQPGSGSWDAIARLRWTRTVILSRLDVFASASYKLNGENDLDYRFGDETILIGGFAQRFTMRWSWSAQLTGRRTGRDRFLGDHVPSTGARSVDLGPGLRFDDGNGLAVFGYLDWPVYQDVHEQQLAPRAGFVLGVSKTF